MSFNKTRNRYDVELNLKEMEEETSSTTGDSKLFGSLPETAMAKIIVLDKEGTSPTLDVTLQGSDDEESWEDITSFPQMTDEGHQQLALGPLGYNCYRYNSTIGGTDSPSFTYIVYLTC